MNIVPYLRSTAPRSLSRHLCRSSRFVLQHIALTSVANSPFRQQAMSYINDAKGAPQHTLQMHASNRLKTVLDGGKTALGAWQMLKGSNISRMLANSGVDWVLVDCEHGNLDDAAMHESVPAIAAAGVSPIVRIPDLQSWMVKRALDAGAHGVLVPLIRSVKEAEELVQASKFPPRGKRGFGSPFSPQRFDPRFTVNDYLHQANDAILTMVQIETREALEAVDEIAAVDGIDVLFIGPFDLGNNIGHPITPAGMAPQLQDAIEKIFAATQKAGKKCGIYCATPEQAKQYRQKGFEMVHVVTDYMALDSIVKDSVKIALD